ncbi:DUF4411 domain-containing protein [Rhodopseudomonas palustris]|uniref:DUF4411 domain-containing protein n=1 Tax=Rhodopseudomonas palustris TaxID=1076 RepID=A0A323UZ91_RHOPL|nr:DUF4411 family protein [Rhodopseudomonas palustris]PZA13218.1 DUF4411 domain-containing protein [Rhodopseudomonas palustris]
MAGTIYCIDTSALIAAWYERYKPNRFPKLWEQFDQLVASGRLVSSTLVLRECSKRSEELYGWLKLREAMFATPDEAVQLQVDHIVNTYTGLVTAGKEKFQADPFVIALAKVYGYTVVTEETGIGSLGKIPGVCNAMKVDCINLMKLIDEQDWVLG